MSRPPPSHRRMPPPVPLMAPSDDITASFGGLAEALEPDPDAITSMRRLAPAARRPPPSLRTNAAHAAHAAAPISVRQPAPIQLQDFAFADTVFAKELEEDELPPPSGPIYVNDSMGNTQCVTPLAFPLPDAAEHVDFPTRLRVMLAHVRHAIRGALDEMRELWAGTAEMVDGGVSGSRIDRVFALWSCFQWSRADLTRAAMIGLGVFITAAAIGATTLDYEGDGAAAASGSASSTEVRGGRTLDQHTGKKTVVHAKR
ncbi:MAG: hypothetical protein QOI41_3230 [Myxococcales bacterium]|nr:hypothetical protein [Myxococcales bacterium]